MVPSEKPAASSSAELNTMVQAKRPAEVDKSAGARRGLQLSGSKPTAMAVVTKAQGRNRSHRQCVRPLGGHVARYAATTTRLVIFATQVNSHPCNYQHTYILYPYTHAFILHT